MIFLDSFSEILLIAPDILITLNLDFNIFCTDTGVGRSLDHIYDHSKSLAFIRHRTVLHNDCVGQNAMQECRI